MFCSIRQYEGCTNTDELISRAHGELLPVLRDMEGYHDYQLVNCGDGDIISLTKFDTEEQAEAANEEVRILVQKSFSELLPEPPEISTGELIVEDRR